MFSIGEGTCSAQLPSFLGKNHLLALCVDHRPNLSPNMNADLCATHLAEFAIENDLLPPNIKQDADEQSVARCIGKIMAGTFGALDAAEIDGFKFRSAMRYYSPESGKIIPRYTFQG